MYNSKVALLCNGPSRSAYDPNKEYAFRIGCNIPWTEVDCTVVLDIGVIQRWVKKPDMIKFPTYLSRTAQREANITGLTKTHGHLFLGTVNPEPEYDSCGHQAATVLINKGYKDIDIYGCDAYFENVIESYTWDIVPERFPNRNMRNGTRNKRAPAWRDRWNKMIQKYPDIKFNFIRGVEDVKEL